MRVEQSSASSTAHQRWSEQCPVNWHLPWTLSSVVSSSYPTFHLPLCRFFAKQTLFPVTTLLSDLVNIRFLPVSLQVCRCWSRGPSPGPSSSRRASGRGVSGRFGVVNGAARRWPWRSSHPARSAPGSARPRSTRPWCLDTRTFWASSLPTTRVRSLQQSSDRAGLLWDCTSTYRERVRATIEWRRRREYTSD